MHAQIQCISFLLAYLLILQIFGISKQLGPLLVMIGEMSKDIVSFLVRMSCAPLRVCSRHARGAGASKTRGCCQAPEERAT